jgi:hypothetical protein
MIGQKEQHSADGKSHILHSAERKWTVVWKGVPYVNRTTRELARKDIRGLKLQFAVQLDLPGLS